MEIILNSVEHKINDNCLRYNFKQPIRFNNQYIGLTNMRFHNFFPNIDENYKLKVKYTNREIEINFQKGAYNVFDISNIINLELKENSIDIEDPIKMIVDINQYKILIIIKEDFKLILDKNFMKLLGFSKYVINTGYNRSDLIPQIDKTKFLKIYCNIVDNKNNNEHLTNVSIKNGIGDLVTYDNFNSYKRQKIMETDFDFIDICIKNQDNKNIELTDYWEISLYINKIKL